MFLKTGSEEADVTSPGGQFHSAAVSIQRRNNGTSNCLVDADLSRWRCGMSDYRLPWLPSRFSRRRCRVITPRHWPIQRKTVRSQETPSRY